MVKLPACFGARHLSQPKPVTCICDRIQRANDRVTAEAFALVGNALAVWALDARWAWLVDVHLLGQQEQLLFAG
jgi:hypothetical protein